jgi:hypothetical protein
MSSKQHGSVMECMSQINVALEKHDMYRNNYDIILQLPIVKELQEKNKKLKTKLKEYKVIVEELTAKLDGIKQKHTRDSICLTHPIHMESRASVPCAERIEDTYTTESTEEKQPEMVDFASSMTEPQPTEPKSQPNIVYEIIEKTLPENTAFESEEDVVEEEEEDTEEVVVEATADEDVEEEVEEPEDDPKEPTVVPSTEPEAESEEEEEEEEMEEEVYEVTIEGKTYYTTNETSGVIYAVTSDGEIGDEVGSYKDGKPVFNK